ncbi:tetraspanin-8 [Mixophyes fleayi]|uniref:tetraspanin-8 n=1 Tax=Mixophyes fleayi TaxID=3061075 RepID=UPI003F4E3A1D
MAGVNKCLKYSMFTFNFLFWLCGCVILGVSIWLRVSKSAQQELNLQGSSMLSAIDLLIAVGAIIMVLGFFGCCGAIKESRCLLILFFIGLLLILLLQVTAGILGVVFKPKIEENIKTSLEDLLPLNRQNQTFQDALKTIQEENNCCGISQGIEDWGNNPPESCRCDPSKEPGLCTSRSYYKETCVSVITEYFQKHLAIIIGIAFGLAVVELFGLGFSMTLYCQIKKK